VKPSTVRKTSPKITLLKVLKINKNMLKRFIFGMPLLMRHAIPATELTNIF